MSLSGTVIHHRISKSVVLGLGIVALSASLLTSCAGGGSAEAAPHGTVVLRDGSRLMGNITASATEVTLVGDDKQTQKIAMSQVRRIDYDLPPAEPASNGTAPTGSANQAVHEEHVHPQPAAIKTRTYSLVAGTELSVRTEETIDSSVAAEGQTYAGEITQDIRDAAGDVVIPDGSNAQIVIVSASKGGKIKGASDLVLDLAWVSVGGQRYSLSTEDLEQKGSDGIGANKRTGIFTGGGAAIGAVIGAIAGGGKGAAIGAASGAGAGAATQVITKGSIKIPVETVLTFKLDRPLHVTAR